MAARAVTVINMVAVAEAVLVRLEQLRAEAPAEQPLVLVAMVPHHLSLALL
jgi:hypothetical protein